MISLITVLSILLTALYLSSKTDITDNSETDRHFNFSYQLEIEKLPTDAGDLDIWIPFPLSDENQQVTGYKVDSELEYEFYIDTVYGNKMLHFSSSENGQKAVRLEIKFEVIRREDQSILNSTEGVEIKSDLDLSRFLGSNGLVPIDGRVAEEAALVVEENISDLEKIEKLYWHLNKSMQYDKSGDGWGNGDALFACDYRKGNCTDIHSLFIGMARSLNIPARFVIGFPLPADKATAVIPGYHCWAEFYLPQFGWIPVDISEAIKHPEKVDYFFGRLDPNRVSFSIGRDIKLPSAFGEESLNYFIYPYVLVDGQPYFEMDYNFGFSDI